MAPRISRVALGMGLCAFALTAGCATPSVESDRSDSSVTPPGPEATPPATSHNGTERPGQGSTSNDAVHRVQHEHSYNLWEETRDGNDSYGYYVGESSNSDPVTGAWSSFWVNATWTDPIEATWRVCVSLWANEGNLTAHVPPTRGNGTFCSEPAQDSAQLRIHDMASLSPDALGCASYRFELVSSPNPVKNQSAAVQISIIAAAVYHGEAAEAAQDDGRDSC